MRIDVDMPDGMYWQVYFNGERVPNCIEADTDNGWILVLARAMSPGIIHWRGKYHVKKLTGRVELVHIDSGKVVR